ncbi:multidrug efflux MATE transporter CdeA [Clostridioides difficile]|uniref:multidrug efflux MATE transporter CdeA n=1 Tax=Clostridioides difficile TaxID=1496 RepID=UPI00041946A6|nr:multidrug efflux MATE transporter CdeA [Clostridioides difficile]
MENLFTRKFTTFEFLKFVSPAIISMIFISLYTIIDGIFVSTLVGSDALASINIVLPIINLVCGFGIMMATGGGAIVSIRMGENRQDEANSTFSFIVLFSLIVGILFTVISYFFIKEISILLGATDKLLPYCITYGKVMILCTPFYILKFIFEYFARTDGNSKFSLFLSVIGGVTNIILDYVFIKYFGMGLLGAAVATAIGIILTCVLGIIYFLSNKSTLKLRKPKTDFRLIRDTMINGSSEMVTELSTGITTFLFNVVALKLAGENGLAALTIVLYAHFLMTSVYLGFVAGVSPLISYNFGAENSDKLKETFKHSLKFIFVSSLLVFIIALVFAPFIVRVFVSPDNTVFKLALQGLKIFAFAFLFVGINIFASGFFTAFHNGKISAIISFSRAFVFIIIGIIILPPMLNMTGLWLTVPFAEVITIFISILFIKKYKCRYKY